jgi:hypothetical protein
VSTVVKPEYGPTLAEITGRRWPKVRIALIVLGVIVAVWLGVKWFGGSDPRSVVVVKGPVAINVLRNSQLERIAPYAGEELRLRSTVKGIDQTFAVSPFTIPPYVGLDPGGVMPVFASNEIAKMQAADPKLRIRSEGRTRVNLYPGYVITYDTMKNGELYYGKRLYLWPDVPSPKEGVRIDMLARKGTPKTAPFVMPGPNDVGTVGPTKLPLRSFNFGTERPS